MASHAGDLGPFASEQGPISRSAVSGALLGLASATVAGLAVVLEASGVGFDARPYVVPAAATAIVVCLAAMYVTATRAAKGRLVARWGLLLGVAGGIAAVVQGAVHSGSLELSEFGLAYFDADILSAIWRDMQKAAFNTIKYAAIAEAIAMVIGLVVAVMAISKNRWVRAPAIVYVDVLRGLPLLMLILLVAFAPTYVGITLPTITAGIIALTLNSSAYVAEIFRAGIQAVDKGQMDAARSLGMPYATAMVQVVIPQAARNVIPPLTNEFIALIKDTSLLNLIGMTVGQRELLTAARQLSASTFSATPFMAASIAYLAITLPLIRLVTILERRLTSGEQRSFSLALGTQDRGAAH